MTSTFTGTTLKLHHVAAWGSSHDRNPRGREETPGRYARLVGAPVPSLVRRTTLSDMLGSSRTMFLLETQYIELSSVFEDFRPWLKNHHFCFSDGFDLERSFDKRKLRTEGTVVGSSTPEFDEETLWGHITFDKIVAPVSSLTGKLEGLATER